MNVYVHVPFCKSKCAYCSFTSHCPISDEEKYISALLKEMKVRSESLNNDKIDTIYFGGGTPSYIRPQNIQKIIYTLKELSGFADNIEITLEANPEDVTIENLTHWKDSGVNRISLGVQSLDDGVRRQMGRQLSAEAVFKRIDLAKEYIDSICIDLISGLPNENPQIFLDNLIKVTNLNINHISIYDLEISPGSQIHKNISGYCFQKEAVSVKTLKKAWAIMLKAGYEQYEISNFAKKNKHCRHNLDFWIGKDYLGFGLSAASKHRELVMENTSDFNHYLKGWAPKVTRLTAQELELLKVSCAVRLNRPLPDEFMQKYPAVILDLVSNKLLGKDGKITKKGKIFNNVIINQFAMVCLS